MFISLRSLTAHPLRSALTALAIALGVAMMLSASAIGQAASQSAERLSQANATDAVVQSGPAFNTLIFQALLALVGVIVLFTAGFVIANAFGMAVTARLKELGALRTLGMTRRQILDLVLIEAGLLGLAGAVGGLLLGLGLAGLALRLTGMGGNVSVPVWALIASPLIGFTVTVGAALLPALQASRISPLQALKPESSVRAQPPRPFLPAAFIGLLLVGLGLYAFIGKPDVFTAIGVLLPAMVVLLALVAMLMPALVGPVANLARPWLIRWVGHTAGRLAADNLQRHPTRAALTAGAMTAGLTMMIAISGLMTVFLKGGLLVFATIAGDDRGVMFDLSDPATFRAENSLQMFIEAPPLPPELLARLQILANEGQVELDRLDMVTIPAELSPTPSSPGLFMDPEVFVPRGFAFSEGNVEDALRYFAQGPAVLLLPITAQRLNLQVGDTVSVQTLTGPVDFTVAGIGADVWVMTAFSFTDGQKYFGVTEPTFMGISVREGQNPEVVLKQVDDIVADYGLVAFDMKTLLREFFRIGDQIIGLMNALLLLTVLVAALGVVNTMVINVTERQREIGMLRAIGATQRQVRQMVVAEGVTLGLFAVFAAVLVSLIIVLAYFLLVSPNGLQSLGFRLNWEIVRTGFLPALPVMAQATLVALIFAPLIAGLAAYYPARQAAALDVIEATRAEGLSLQPIANPRPEGEPEPDEAKPHLPVSFTSFFVTRVIQEHRTRFVLSVLGVVIGVAVTIASAYLGSGIAGLGNNEDFRRMGGGAFGEAAKSIQLTGVSVSLAVGFLIFNAFAMSFTQRRQQLGLLRTLGATRAQIQQLALAEATLIGILGTLLGLLLGEFMGLGFIAFLRASGGFFNAFTEQPTTLSTYLLAAALGLGVPLLAMLIPARAAMRLSPLSALNAPDPAPVRARSPRPYVLLLFAPLLLLIRPPALEPPYDLYGLGALALLWLGILALALPSALDSFSALVRWGAVTASLRLIAENLPRARTRSLITATTLTVGVTLIIAITGAITFYTHELILSRMDDIRAAQINLVTHINMEAGLTMFEDPAALRMPPAALADLQTHFGDRGRFYPMGYVAVPELSYFSDVSFSYVLNPAALRDHLTGFFVFTEGDWEHAYPLMENGCGVLIAPFLAKRENVKLYDTLTVTSPLGQQVDCVIAGIGRGQNSTTIISDAALAEFDDGSPLMLIAQAANGAEADAFFADLDTYARANGFYALAMNDLFDFMVKTVDALPLLFNGILLFAILAATLGVVNTTLISLVERRRELGQLRALGLTRRQTLTLVVGEAALLGVFGAGFGVVAGAGFVLMMVTTIGGKGMGFTDFPIYAATFRTLGAAMVNGVAALLIAPVLCALAAYYPARDMLRGPAIELLQTEATQRAQHANASHLPRALAWLLAGRALAQDRTRTALSLIAIALGATMTVAGDVLAQSIIGVVMRTEDLRAIGEGLWSQLDPTFKGIGAGIMLAAGFLIFNTFAMSLTQRRQQLGVLRALGMTRGQVLRMALTEALIIGGAGTALGLALGPFVGQAIIAFMRSIPGMVINVFVSTQPAWSSFVLAAALGLGVTLLAALLPAQQAMKLSPLVALKTPELPGLERTPAANRLGLLGLVLCSLLTVYLVLSPPALWLQPPADQYAALVISAGWVLGLALLLPALVGVMGALVRPLFTRWFGATGRLMADNFQRGRGRVLLTIATLAISLTMIGGLTGFIQFFFAEFFGPNLEALKQEGAWAISMMEIEAGLAGYADMESLRFPPEAMAAMRATTGERGNFVPFGFVIVPELSFMGDAYFSFIINPHALREAGPLFMTFKQGDWDTALPILERGCGVLLTPAVAARNNVKAVGDTFTVTSKYGPVTCAVAGIGTTFVGATIISDVAQDQFDKGDPFTLFIQSRPGVDSAQLEADLQQTADQYGAHILRMSQYTELMLTVFESTPLFFNAFLLLAVLAAALGVVNTTMISVTERRREFGQLRALGATRAQVRAMVVGEAVLMGLLGGLIGLIASVGLTVIFATVYGGATVGIANYQPWAAAFRTLAKVWPTSLIGVLASPLICALAAYFPANSILRGAAIETLQPEATQPITRQRIVGAFSRGSIQTRFVLGVSLLLLIVLASLIQVVTAHARNYLVNNLRDSASAMVGWNAAMVEAALPAEAQTIDLAQLAQAQGQSFDANALLRFRSLIDDMTEGGLKDFVLADKDNIVLISLDQRQIGDELDPLDDTQRTVAREVKEEGDAVPQVLATAPLHNRNGDFVGSLRMTLRFEEIKNFLDRVRNTLWALGAVIVGLGLVASYLLSQPFTRAARVLASHTARVAQSDYSPITAKQFSNPLVSNLSIRTRLTLLMVLFVVGLVSLMGLIVIPIERDQLDRTGRETGLTVIQWMGDFISSGLETSEVSQTSEVFDIAQMLTAAQNLDFARLQTLTEQTRNNVTYLTIVDTAGTVILSDKIALQGEPGLTASRAQITDGEWQGESVIIASTPLTQGRNGRQIGTMNVAFSRAQIETFLIEAQNLFWLTGLIAVLAGLLLAQMLGGAVAAPLEDLTLGARRVAQGDLNVRFRAVGTGVAPAPTGDELAQLAHAFNQMVAGLREREKLRDLFGRYVSREVSEAVLSGRVSLKGERKTITCLYVDMRGSTTFAEQHKPEEVMAALNEYFEVIILATETHGGIVNRFVGDEAVCVFGAPTEYADHADRALQAALAVRAGLAYLNQKRATLGLPILKFGMGLNTGAVVAGATGSEERQEYTVIGDAMNVGARIQALTKTFSDHDIVLSEFTHAALRDRADDYEFVDLGGAELRGKRQPVRVLGLRGPQ